MLIGVAAQATPGPSAPSARSRLAAIRMFRVDIQPSCMTGPESGRSLLALGPFAAAVVATFPDPGTECDGFGCDGDLGQGTLRVGQPGPDDPAQLGVDRGVRFELAIGGESAVDLVAGALVGVLRAELHPCLAV